MRNIKFPVTKEILLTLHAGEMVLLSGFVATARDAAHKLMLEGGVVPFDLATIPVFYMGPSPAPPGHVIGSCGPTTSARMEPFIDKMLSRGMKIVIGKGEMSQSARDSFQKNSAIYFAAVGGAGALASTRIVSREVIAYNHLGPEAIAILELNKLPAFVAWDLHSKSIYGGTR